MKRYSLQSYKGIATRHTCPSCGDKRSFVYYVDEENTPLHPSVGRCNYESSCAATERSKNRNPRVLKRQSQRKTLPLR